MSFLQLTDLVTEPALEARKKLYLLLECACCDVIDEAYRNLHFQASGPF